MKCMSNESIIQTFDGSNVRILWNEKEERYYFSVSDVVMVLADTTNPVDYIKKMRQRDKELSGSWKRIVKKLSYETIGGRQHINFATIDGILRIVQSIPSKKAEPLKRWLAEVGSQRIDQVIDPELTFQMAVEDYRRQGYSDRWINERMKSIRMRKELTGEWERSGVRDNRDFAVLTDILTKAWSGMTTGEYKRHKGLTKQNLRDNMTNVELALNTLAEVATTEISRQRNPKGIKQSRQTAKAGGRIARNARQDLEQELGHSVISSQKASDYLAPADKIDTKKLKK